MAERWLSDKFLVDLYWSTTGDDWAIPDSVMVAFARAVLAADAPKPGIVPESRETVRMDCASRAVRWLSDTLDEKQLAGLWMQIVHDGYTDDEADWNEAYGEARAAQASDG